MLAKAATLGELGGVPDQLRYTLSTCSDIRPKGADDSPIMPWVDGHIQVNHPREPWEKDTPHILVHSHLSALKGKKTTSDRDAYNAAKFAFDMDAAYQVVERSIDAATMDNIIAHVVVGGLNGRIIMPHPAFDDEDGLKCVSTGDRPKNAIPFAYAGYLSRKIGRPVDEEIVQLARVGRTKLGKWPRFLYQPSFGGAVRVDQPYIIVDDAVTTAGTMAALRSYIVRNGGSVLFASALASSTGKNRPFAIRPETTKALTDAFGDGLQPYWLETVGHEVQCLTEAEGLTLGELSDEKQKEGIPVGDALLQRLRTRIDEAAT